MEALRRLDEPLAQELFTNDHAIDRLEIEIERTLRPRWRSRSRCADLRFITPR